VCATSIMNMCLSLNISNQTIQYQLLARCGIVKQFEKLIEFSLWEPVAEFEIICNGRVCQEIEDLSVQLSMSCFWLNMIFYYFCHIVVRSLFFISTMSEVAVMLQVEKCFVPMSAVALCRDRESSFLEVRFDKKLPWRDAQHPA